MWEESTVVWAEFDQQMNSKAVRTALVTNTLPPYRQPVFELLTKMKGLRLEVWLMSRGEKKRNWGRDSTPNVTIRYFQDWGFDLSRTEGPILHFNPAMLQALIRHKPDIAILGGYDSATALFASLVLKILSIPFLFWIESTLQQDRSARTLARPFLRSIIGLSEGAIVPGTAAGDYAVTLGVPRDRIFIAPNSVDTRRFAPCQSKVERGRLRALLGLPDRLLILYVGRLTLRKGVLDLLDAFANLAPANPNAHLVIVGGGPLRPVLLKRTFADQTLSERVHLVGYCSEADLPMYYAACDIFSLPTRMDVWGMVINEAMSAALPVVCSTEAGGVRDLVREGRTGLVHRSSDIASLTNALATLLTNPTMRERLGRSARERILGGFTPEHQARAIAMAVAMTTNSSSGES